MAKGMVDTSQEKWLPAQRNKHVVVKRRIGAPTLQIALKRGARRIVQGNEPCFFEFRVSDNQPIRVDIAVAQINRFGYS